MDREKIIRRLRSEAGAYLSEEETRKILIAFPGKKLDDFSRLSNEELRFVMGRLRMQGFFEQSENMILASSARWWEWILGMTLAAIVFLILIPVKIFSLIFMTRQK